MDVNIRKQKLKPEFIDTTEGNIFVYDVRYALIYFRQSDIENFIDSPGNNVGFYNSRYNSLRDKLNQDIRKIRVTHFYFSYDQKFLDSIFQQKPIYFSEKQLSEEFYAVGAALILEGRFMLLEKTQKKVLTRKLVAKKKKGILGARYLQFYLPDGRPFYSIITRFGE